MTVHVDEESGRRYLDPIDYEPVVDEHGARIGWRVPEHERDRWDNPPRFKEAARPAEQPRPLSQLVVELEAWVDLDPKLERSVRAAYDRDPLRVTRLVVSVVGKAERREIRNPAGLLWRRLQDIAQRPDPPPT